MTGVISPPTCLSMGCLQADSVLWGDVGSEVAIQMSHQLSFSSTLCHSLMQAEPLSKVLNHARISLQGVEEV